MRKNFALALALALLAISRPAHAESDSHYQDTLLGARAAGMGGASLALGGEATGSFYNPAGIVVDKSALIQVSMSAYRWRHKKTTVLDVCGTTVDDDEGALFGFSASVGFVKLFGKDIRHAVGISLLVPYMSKSSQSYLVDDAQCGKQAIDLGGSSWLIDRVFIGALSYAMRPWRRLQLGVNLGFAVRDLSVSGLSNFALREGGVPDGTTVNLSYTELDVTLWSLYVQLGAIVELLPGLRVGLSVTSPYVRLSGQGRWDGLEAFRDPTAGAGTAEVLTLDDAEFYWKVPLKLGLGLAYQRTGVFSVAADVKLHLPVARYYAVEHPQVPKADSLTVERKLVVNVNVGGEVWILPNKLALRAGFFTNFSSQPEPSDAALINEDAESIDLFGGSIGGAYRTNKASLLTFAVQVMYGSGKTARLRIRPGATAQDGLNAFYEIGNAKDLSVLISIGGAVDLD